MMPIKVPLCEKCKAEGKVSPACRPCNYVMEEKRRNQGPSFTDTSANDNDCRSVEVMPEDHLPLFVFELMSLLLEVPSRSRRNF